MLSIFIIDSFAKVLLLDIIIKIKKALHLQGFKNIFYGFAYSWLVVAFSIPSSIIL